MSNINSLEGCFNLSNPITVNRQTGNDCIGNAIINEVIPSGFVEIKNNGSGAIDISSFWLVNGINFEIISNLNLSCGTDFILDPGEAVTLITSFGILDLVGEIGLYSSNTGQFNDPDFILDYVQWGSSTNAHVTTAVSAGEWTVADFVPAINSESISYDGEGISSNDWFASEDTRCDENTLVSETAEFSFSIYPNPSAGTIFFDNVVSGDSTGDLMLYDTFGKLVYQGEINLISSNPLSFDLTPFKDGNYILTVIVGDENKSVLISKFTQ